MALMNTRLRYGRVAQFLHWVTALLILTLIPLGVVMAELPIGTGEQVALKVWLYSLHKTLGVTVLAVAVLRIVWAAVNPKPVPLHPERRLETFAAETVHWILYAAIILTPVTGLLHHAASTGFAPIWWPFGQDFPFVPKDEFLSVITGFMHWAIAIALAVSLVGHIGGAMKHLVIDKDQTLARMTGGEGVPVSLPQAYPGGHTLSVVAAVIFLFGAIAAGMLLGFTEATKHQFTASDPSPAAETASSDDAWSVDHDASTLGIRITQLGSPVDGSFSSWRADIVFDPDNLAAASVEARIDTGSLSVGTVSAQAVGPEFLDSEAFPQAVFASTDFRAAGEGLYEAHGTLTLHGVDQPLVLPFELDIENGTASMRATVTLNRIDFDIGVPAHATEESVGFAVDVNIEILARKPEPDSTGS
ncbi:YceI family protein [Oricola sp.]|uniref:YceI family protein n=1 Tax=Oricola sp. TaxID=1979950 RepID=UPI003BAB138F